LYWIASPRVGDPAHKDATTETSTMPVAWMVWGSLGWRGRLQRIVTRQGSIEDGSSLAVPRAPARRCRCVLVGRGTVRINSWRSV